MVRLEHPVAVDLLNLGFLGPMCPRVHGLHPVDNSVTDRKNRMQLPPGAGVLQMTCTEPPGLGCPCSGRNRW